MRIKNLLKRYILLIPAVFFFCTTIWLWNENGRAGNTITELNKAAKIDYAYENKAGDYTNALFLLWQLTSDTLAKDMKSTLTNQEIKQFMEEYPKLVDEVKRNEDIVKQARTERSEIFHSFKYAKVYTPTSE